MTNRVLREQLEHLVLVGVDGTFQNLASGWHPVAVGKPLVGQPGHLVVAVEEGVGVSALLSLWRFN